MFKLKNIFIIFSLAVCLAPVHFSLAALEVSQAYPEEKKSVSTENIQFGLTIVEVVLYILITFFFFRMFLGVFSWFGYSGDWGMIEEAQHHLAYSIPFLIICIALAVALHYFGTDLALRIFNLFN